MQNTLEKFVVDGAEHMAKSNGAGWDRARCEELLRDWTKTILQSGGGITSISSGLWTVTRDNDDSTEWSLERKFLWANLNDNSDYDIHNHPY